MFFRNKGLFYGTITVVLMFWAWQANGQCATTISTFPYVEDFEASQGGWTSGGTNNDWAWGTPNKGVITSAGSGTKCWVTGGLTGSFYNYSELSYIESPCFDFTSLQHPFIAFKMYRESEWKFDGSNLQYSLDQGTTWANVGSFNDVTDCMNANWYNYATVSYLVAPLVTVKNGWCGNHDANFTQGGVTCQGGNGSLGWIQAKHCMQNLAGKPSVKFRFTFGAGTTCNGFDGIAFDSISISEAVANTGTLTYNCTSGTTATFTGTAGLPCTDAFAWNFGDAGSGASNTASTATAAHTFSAPGTYTVSLTISGGPCNAPVTLTKTIDILSVTAAVQNTSCFGGSDGGITLTETGGTGPNSYNWGGGITTQNRTGLASGSYTVTVSDPQSCPVTVTANVGHPAPVNVNATPTGAGCNGGTSGSINTAVSGGTAPYTYNWGNGVTSANRTNLSAGTYNVTVTDNKGCTATATATVTQSAAITATITTTNTTCGASTGTVNLTVANGNAPYHFLWSNTATTQNLANVGGGTYTVTITDAGGCTVTASGTVAQTGAPTVTATPIQISCNNANDGQVNLTVTGGTPNYTYAWSSTQITQNIANLSAGPYTVTVLDAQGCSVTASATIINPAPVAVNLTSTNENCFGNSNATITSAVTGGTTPYSYSWSNTATTANLSGLAAATYTVTVKDANQCSATAGVTITEPAQLSANATPTPATCFGQANGSVALTVTGGTNPYGFAWNNTATTQNLSAVIAGTYTVAVLDANGCSATASAIVTQPTAITITGNVTNAQCFGYTYGAVTTTVTGGAGGYTYLWSNTATTQNLSNVANGAYTLIATDASGCTATQTFNVGSPPAIVIINNTTNVNCFGGADGSISVSATGGSGTGYSYLWSTNPTTASISNLSAGPYNVTVTDGNNCSTSASYTVTQPANVALATTSTPQACINQLDGAAAVVATGGTPPYTYNWSNQANTSSINNLTAGTYYVTVTDAHLCTYTDSTIVTLQPAVTYTSSDVQPFCAPLADGSISISVTGGGTPPFSYTWNNQTGGPSLTNLVAGNYYLVITDARGCIAQDSFNLQYQYSITVSASPAVTIELGQSTELSATSNVYNNVAFTWSPVNGLDCSTCQNTGAQPVRTTLYYVNVTDSNGCYANDSVLVTVIPNYNLFIPNCFTPNGDGNNDLFQMFGNKKAIIFWEIKVFNRWGELVFESNDINFGWDGSYKGHMQDPGVFVYEAKVVFLDDYTRNNIKGSLTLLR